MQIRKFKVTPELLAAVLHLPEGTEIVGVDWDVPTMTATFYVHHNDFAPRAGDIPTVEVRCHQDLDGPQSCFIDRP